MCSVLRQCVSLLCVLAWAFGLWLVGASSYASGAEQEALVAIRESLREYFAKVHSFEYSCIYRSSTGLTSNVDFVEQGNSYRMSRKDTGGLLSAKYEPVNYEVAFDGVEYQEFDRTTSALNVASVSGGYINFMKLGIDLPHIAIFKWLYDARSDGDGWRLNVLATPELFDRRFTGAEYIEARDGTHLVRFPQLRSTPGKWFYEVSFNPNGYMLPVSVIRRRIDTGEAVWSSKVLEVLSVTTPEGSLPFPTEVEIKSDGETTLLQVSSDSLKMNSTVDIGEFRIDQADVKSIYDVDKKQARAKVTEEMVAAKSEEATISAMRNRWGLLLICFSVVVVLGIVIWVRYRKARV